MEFFSCPVCSHSQKPSMRIKKDIIILDCPNCKSKCKIIFETYKED